MTPLMTPRGFQQAAACVSMYGPRTTMAVALPAASTGQRRGRVIEFTLQASAHRGDVTYDVTGDVTD